MAEKPKPKELKLDRLELALLQRNTMAREIRDVKISILDTQVSQFDFELFELVKNRLGINIREVTVNTNTGEIITDPKKQTRKVG